MAIEQDDWNPRRPFPRARVELHPKIPVMSGNLKALVAALGKTCQ
jgi:hypothetical protein